MAEKNRKSRVKSEYFSKIAEHFQRQQQESDCFI
jgi:hypothetical protein